jgi:D-galactonate transporter
MSRAAVVAPAQLSEEQEALERAYHKAAWRIVPYLMLLQILSWLDRVNVGFAKLQMLSDLGFSEAVYGFGAGIFFVGYFLFEVPSNLLLTRIGARKTLARITMLWGIVTVLMIFVNSATSFYVLRFLLGAFEAGLFPGILLYSTQWFPARRRAQLVGFYVGGSAVAGIFGGPLAGAIMSATGGVGGLTNWQWLFVLEGIPSIIVGFITLFYLVDGPSQAKWLSDREKRLIDEDLELDRRNAGPRQKNFVAALALPRVWILAVIYFCLVSANATIAFWAPSIIKNLGVSNNFYIGLIAGIPYIVGAICMVLNGRHSDRTLERRYHCAVAMLTAAIGLFLVASLSDHPVLALLALVVAAAGVLSAFPPFWELPMLVLTGVAAAGGVALINSIGNLSGFVAPYLIGFLKDVTGSFSSGLYCVVGFELVGILMILLFIPKRAAT